MHDPVKVMTELRSEAEKTVCLFEEHPPIDVVSSKVVSSIPEAWSPVHLMCSAAESCFVLSLKPLAEKMRIGIVSYASTAEAVFEAKDDKHLELSSIVIRPTIHLENEEDRSRLPLLVKKAEEYCYVARSLKVPITVEI